MIMVASLTYRTDDGTRWGGGQGSNLAAVTIDLNFWNLFAAVSQLETDQANFGAGIDFITQPTNGNIFFIHLTDHRVLGPFTIPTAQWTPRGNWQPLTAYALYDTVSDNGSLYLIITPHTSGATFSPFATDGLTHELYALLLEQPANELPSDGTIHQRLAKASGSPFATQWVSDLLRMFVFVPTPDPSEVLIQYPVVDHMTIPAGLAGSVVFNGTPPALNTTYFLNKNGAAIGTITFTGPSPSDIVVAFPAITFVPGDIFTLVAPAAPDANQANISFTLVALLT